MTALPPCTSTSTSPTRYARPDSEKPVGRAEVLRALRLLLLQPQARGDRKQNARARAWVLVCHPAPLHAECGRPGLRGQLAGRAVAKQASRGRESVEGQEAGQHIG